MNHQCPVCQGTCRMPVPEQSQQYKNVIAGYDKHTDTFPCNNCGGQYMYGKPRGTVPLRADGTPCKHDYWRTPTQWRSVTKYKCAECGDTYEIDSGD